MATVRFLGILLVLALAAACHNDDKKLTGDHLIGDGLDEALMGKIAVRVHELRTKPVPHAPGQVVYVNNGEVALGESFTPDSLLMPITGIGLVPADEKSQWSSLYECKHNCEVDVLDGAELERTFGAAASDGTFAQPGTYTAITINTCYEGADSRWDLSIRGTAYLDGVTWVTQPGPEPLTTAVENKDHATMASMGCVVQYPFRDPLVVKAGDQVTVNVFVSPDNTSYALSGQVQLGNVCFYGQLNTLCPGQPTATPYVGAVTPSVEKYLISDVVTDATGVTASGLVMIMFDQAGREFGGTTQIYVGAHGFTYFNFAFLPTGLEWSDNGDGSFHANSMNVDFPAFRREAHTGTLTYKYATGNQDWLPVEYVAVPIP